MRPGIRPEFLTALQFLITQQTAHLADLLRSDGFPFEPFKDFLKDHRLTNRAFVFLENADLRAASPSHFLDWLETLRSATMNRQTEQLATLRTIDETFQAAGIPFMLMKGFAFAARFQSSPLLRHQSDLDILVHPSRIWDAVRALKSAGMRRPKGAERLSRRWVRWHHEYTFKQGDVGIDLHWKTRCWPGLRLNEDAFWSQCDTVLVEGRPTHTLAAEQSLVLLLISVALDIRRGAGRLKHFLDIHQHVDRLDETFDWPAFFHERKQEQTDLICGNVLAMMVNLFGKIGSTATRNRLARVQEFLVRLDPRMSIEQEQTLALLSYQRGNLQNLLWFQSLVPGTLLSQLGWRLKYIFLFPNKVPRAILLRSQWLGRMMLRSLTTCLTRSPAALARLYTART